MHESTFITTNPQCYTHHCSSAVALSGIFGKMSHRKVHSHGSIIIPFSWEHSPGISKTTRQNQERRSSSLAPSPTPISPPRSGSQGLAQERKEKIPPPPGMAAAAAPPRRSASLKGFLSREEDPFLAAYKECTKSMSLVESGGGEGKKSNRVKSGLRSKRMSIFSCKSSCDVREDSLVRLSRLPPLPRDRSEMFQ